MKNLDKTMKSQSLVYNVTMPNVIIKTNNHCVHTPVDRGSLAQQSEVQ